MINPKMYDSISMIYEERIEKLLSYYNDVLYYIGAFDITQEDAEDALQDTYIEAFTYIDKIRDESKMKFWLLKIAKRQGIRYVGGNVKRSVNEKPLHEYINCPEPGYGYSSDKQVDDFIRELNRESLRELLLRLNEKEQKVLILYYAYGYKLKDIAVIMKESDSNVRSISKRSKEKLRKMIESENLDLWP